VEEFILLELDVLALLCKLLLPLPLVVVLKLLEGGGVSSAKTSGNVILSCNSSSLKLDILFNPDEPVALLLCSLPPSLPPIVEEVGLRNVGRCDDIEESCVAVKEPSCCDCGNGGRSFGRLLIIDVSSCCAGCVILLLLLRNDEPPSVELSGDIPAGGELRAPPALSLIDNEVFDVVNVLFDEAV